LAVLAVLAGMAGFIGYKYALPWWKTKPLPPSGELQVHVLDVGPIDGDAILIVSPTGKTVLIDAGDASKSKVVIDALRRYQIQQLDYFIATHPHPDHIGGAPAVIKAVKVLNVIDNGLEPAAPATEVVKPTALTAIANKVAPNKKVARKRTATSFYDDYEDAVKQSGGRYEKAEPGKKYDLGGGAGLTIFGPTQPYFTKERLKTGGNEPNANSVVMRLDYGDFSMLLPGDAEEQTEQRLLAKDAVLKVKLLKVAHHGSKYATAADFLKRVQPEVAIISDGEWNRYGHPSQAVVDRLKSANVKVYRTDLQGEITITSNGKLKSGKLYEIKTAKEAKSDLWIGREAQKDDASRSGFIAYGDFGPPPKVKTERPK
jgi:beta-lactamase superfamily II metal-dependent hydrolase